MWVRTARPLNRATAWLSQKDPVTSVQEAKNWPESRTKVRTAVSGRWLEWAVEESACQSAEGAEGPGPPASSRDGEPSERPRVQCESNVEMVSEGMHLEAMTNPVRYDGAAQDEHVGPEGAGPAAEAAECTSERENSGRGTEEQRNRTARANTLFWKPPFQIGLGDKQQKIEQKF